ncbi:MAG: peptidoglycan-binding domain-containing protein [Minisyncoccia bacterium]
MDKKFIILTGLLVVIITSLIVPPIYTEAASVGPAACSVSPASASMSQSSSLLFTVTSDRPSVSGDYVYVTAKEFSKGVYSSLNVGKVIPIGASSLDFRVYAENTAEAGSKTFKVYCSTGCPMSGCPSGGSAEVLGSATVSLNITGSNISGGDVVPVEPGENVPTPVTSNVSGKVKLTDFKDLFGSMFPSSVCRQGLKNCRGGFGAGSSGMAPLSVMLSGGEASLVGGEMIELPGGSNTAHPRLFDLTNPLLPVDSRLSGEIRSGGAYDTHGDFGSSLRVVGVAYSKDRKIWAISDSQGNYYVWKDGKRYKQSLLNGGPIQGIVKAGYSYILFDMREDAYDITNGMKFVESYVSLEGTEKEVHELVSAPSGFPKLPYGEKVVLGNDEFILTLNTSSQAGRTREISVHSVNSLNIIAEHNLPSYLGGSLPGGFSSYSLERWGTIPVSGGEYIYFLRSLAHGSAVDPKLYGAQKLTLYKFDFSTKKITEVVKEVSLSPGLIVANTAFGANTANPGIVVISRSSSEQLKMQVYLVSDLIQGKGADTLYNSPILANTAGYSIASFSIGNTTYVYSKDAKVYKLEFDPSSGSATTPSPGSGVPYYPKTPDQPEVAGCPGGTVYQTSAGSLCVSSSGGVTTTTTFNFDTTVVQTGCLGWNAYSTSTGIKCANYSSTVNSTSEENKNGYNLGVVTLREGSAGEAVKELQRFLNSELSLSLVVDGKMGPNTVDAVKQWQSAKGLVSDGLVGPKTKAMMNAEL